MSSTPEFLLWDQCRGDFIPDGALRDIYVVKANLAQWAKLFDRLRVAYHMDLSMDGTARTLPPSVDELFALREMGSPLMNFDVGPINVACHFFDTTQIEFDILPNQISCQSDLNDLLGFLAFVGDVVNDVVILTPENQESEPIITYNPRTKTFSCRALRSDVR